MKIKTKEFVEWAKIKIRLHFLNYDNLPYFKDREIWWCSLGLNIGYEENGKNQNFERPVLILKKYNRFILLAVPFTSKKKIGKYYHRSGYLGKNYYVILSQLRLISSKRLRRKIRILSQKEFFEIKNKVKSIL